MSSPLRTRNKRNKQKRNEITLIGYSERTTKNKQKYVWGQQQTKQGNKNTWKGKTQKKKD